MNLCYFSPGYPPEDGGGIGTLVFRLAHGMNGRGHQVCVVAQTSQNDRVEENNGIEIHRFKYRTFPYFEKYFPGVAWSRFVAGKIRALDRKWKFDLVEFPNWEGVGTSYLQHQDRRTVITQLHTAYFETFVIDHERDKKFSDEVITKMERQAVVASDHLCSSSEYHRSLIAREYAVSPSRIKNIPLGVELPRSEGARDQTFRILFVGRLEKRKGALTLIEAIPEVLKRHPNVRFIFIGNDRRHAPGGKTHQEYFCEKYREHAQSVEFLGFVEPAIVLEYYRQASLFVLPSICENFGLVYAEAMSHGIPVVACRATATPEVVRDGETGILIDPGNPSALIDAICTLIADQPLHARMGQNAKDWVRNHLSVEAMVDAKESWYKQILENKR